MNGRGIYIKENNKRMGYWKDGNRVNWVNDEDNISLSLDKQLKEYIQLLPGGEQSQYLKTLSIKVNDKDLESKK